MTKSVLLNIFQINTVAESLGFRRRHYDNLGRFVTFTYPDTNTHVIHIEPCTKKELMKQLGEELVKCGKIQLRQKLLNEISPFNYGN